MTGIDVLQGNWEVDEEEIEIVNSPKIQLVLCQCFDL